MSGPMETARAAWGDEIPSWVELLALECQASSQNKVAGRMKRSPALVSTVLSRKYKGDMCAVEEIVRSTFEASSVDCPVMGPIASSACRDWQEKAAKFSNVNSLRLRMFRACNRCPRHTTTEEKGANHG
ncbi:hypothetical protein [Nioella sp.]|uniref:hypothetical protein n=1 Tax=Nioella sp. TaxID=1912091 RepID=UPI003518EDDE